MILRHESDVMRSVTFGLWVLAASGFFPFSKVCAVRVASPPLPPAAFVAHGKGTGRGVGRHDEGVRFQRLRFSPGAKRSGG